MLRPRGERALCRLALQQRCLRVSLPSLARRGAAAESLARRGSRLVPEMLRTCPSALRPVMRCIGLSILCSATHLPLDWRGAGKDLDHCHQPLPCILSPADRLRGFASCCRRLPMTKAHIVQD
eukprot:4995095-Alexandrium_andersonii.AAC.1